MAGLEIQPFAEGHLGEAAKLLGKRHRRHREAEPLLPDVGDFGAEITALLEKEGSSGVVGMRDGSVVAYLIGTRLSDDLWGPNVWVELAGHAADEPEHLRDLYAVAAADWVGSGRRAHYAWVPASERELVDAWFRLGFGAQHALALREVPTDAVPAPNVRIAGQEDLEALVALGPLISRHQVLAPVFSGLRASEDPDDLREDILEDLRSPGVVTVVAEIDGQIVGAYVGVPIELSSMHTGLARPPGAALLSWAGTIPAVRGTGAGVALTDAIFNWALEQGYETIVTDWRVTNLLSSRFWPRRGFRATFLRLHRWIA